MPQLSEVRMSASHVVMSGPYDDDGDQGKECVLPVGPDDDDGGIIGALLSLPVGPDDDDEEEEAA